MTFTFIDEPVHSAFNEAALKRIGLEVFDVMLVRKHAVPSRHIQSSHLWRTFCYHRWYLDCEGWRYFLRHIYAFTRLWRSLRMVNHDLDRWQPKLRSLLQYWIQQVMDNFIVVVKMRVSGYMITTNEKRGTLAPLGAWRPQRLERCSYQRNIRRPKSLRSKICGCVWSPIGRVEISDPVNRGLWDKGRYRMREKLVK